MPDESTASRIAPFDAWWIEYAKKGGNFVTLEGLARSAWNAALAAKPEPDGWVAVSERLPDLDVDVLTYSKRDWGVHVGRQEVGMGNRRIWCEHRTLTPRELPYVTHWRTLPTPPVLPEGEKA